MPIIPADELPIDVYHRSAPAWLSKTTLRYYQDNGPAWFKLYLDGAITPATPGGVEQGNALDCFLTEGPEAFAIRFPEAPAGAPRRPSSTQRNAKKPSPETVAAVNFWDAWDAEHPGATILSAEDRLVLQDAVAAVRRLPCWGEIELSLAQATVRRHSDALGLGLQSRPDWLRPSRGAVRDLKKTRDLSRFGGQAIDLGYHLQASVAGWCLAGDGIGMEHASLVAVEWERGARAREYIIPHEVLVYADAQMRALASEIADRLARGDWIDHQEKPEPLPVPGWMLARMEAA